MRCPNCWYKLREGDVVRVRGEVRAMMEGTGVVYDGGEFEYDFDEITEIIEDYELEIMCPRCEKWIPVEEWEYEE